MTSKPLKAYFENDAEVAAIFAAADALPCSQSRKISVLQRAAKLAELYAGAAEMEFFESMAVPELARTR